jgi:hypothetical protein
MIKFCRILMSSILMLIVPFLSAGSLCAQVQTEGAKPDENTFIVFNTGEGLQYFKELAEQMARLKPYGRVDITINSPALKGDFECPDGSCDWHEYASYNRSVEAFSLIRNLSLLSPQIMFQRTGSCCSLKLEF